MYMVRIAADPVVVSAPQLHLASLVVAGVVTVHGDTATVKPMKVFKDELQVVRQKPLPDELQISKWQAEYAGNGQTLLLALSFKADNANPSTYEVAPIPVPQGMFPPRVYPYSDSVRLQVEHILQK